MALGPLHHTLRGADVRRQASDVREQPNSRTIEDNRSTISSQAIEDSVLSRISDSLSNESVG